jgi:hypothetical protein
MLKALVQYFGLNRMVSFQFNALSVLHDTGMGIKLSQHPAYEVGTVHNAPHPYPLTPSPFDINKVLGARPTTPQVQYIWPTKLQLTLSLTHPKKLLKRKILSLPTTLSMYYARTAGHAIADNGRFILLPVVMSIKITTRNVDGSVPGRVFARHFVQRRRVEFSFRM